MAATLLERVKERTDAELSDVELQALIDEADGEITRRYGARLTYDEYDNPQSITVAVEGGDKSLYLSRPMDVADEGLEIVEDDGDGETELVPGDFRVWSGGRRIERLSTGTNARSSWAANVELTYVPIDDSKQRDEVVIKLVKLSIDYEGVARESVDGYSSAPVNFNREREELLASLAPSRVRLA